MLVLLLIIILFITKFYARINIFTGVFFCTTQKQSENVELVFGKGLCWYSRAALQLFVKLRKIYRKTFTFSTHSKNIAIVVVLWMVWFFFKVFFNKMFYQIIHCFIYSTTSLKSNEITVQVAFSWIILLT